MFIVNFALYSEDPLSNVSMSMKFSTAEEAADFCDKNQWPYFIDKPQERAIKLKSYSDNFHWKKRTRVGTK